MTSMASCSNNCTDMFMSAQKNKYSAFSLYKRQLIQFKMIKKWPTWSGMEDSRPIFSCKRFSCKGGSNNSGTNP